MALVVCTVEVLAIPAGGQEDLGSETEAGFGGEGLVFLGCVCL